MGIKIRLDVPPFVRRGKSKTALNWGREELSILKNISVAILRETFYLNKTYLNYIINLFHVWNIALFWSSCLHFLMYSVFHGCVVD